jgi:hypothetical protein
LEYVVSNHISSAYFFKSTQKVIPVAAVKKDILRIQIPSDDMINRNGDIESYVLMHATMAANSQININ